MTTKTKHEFAYMSATKLAHKIRHREVSPVEVMKATLERIEELNPKLGAFVTLVPELALDGARAAEDAVMRGKPLGALHGVPIGIKDLTPTAGIRTTMGSKLFADNVPAEDAFVVKRLKQAGAIIVGKTNTPEFGHKGTTDNLLFPPTRNPWHLERTPGGSSGGSAAAVAAGLVPLAEGGDGGGSVRIPASFTGIYGFIPSAGRIPSDILNPFAGTSPYLRFGTLTRSVEDSALMYQMMLGYSPKDPSALVTFPQEDVRIGIEDGIAGMRIAYSVDLGYKPIDPQVRSAFLQAIDKFRALGAVVEEVDPGFVEPWKNIERDWAKLWYTMLAAIFAYASNEMLEQLDPKVQEFIRYGKSMSAVELMKASYAREMVFGRLNAIHADHDLFLTPTVTCTAFPLGIIGPEEVDGQPLEESFLDWALTPLVNQTGHPAASLPIGFDDQGLPIGLQLIGRRLEEQVIYRAARAYERIAPWGQHRPRL
ncbi:amidase/aspartyl-tRNA(Asn)/glutamyl-tRNA(Gln) amidotransferase subunit A [Tumebacillus sp. BK434]|uniref:amidase n=1 Tax=Tumebacillus sp. BK434 TaxID=2512169 RepID=UPI00104FC821|nr:amidase family protein [Tumebacillus sp. BK434]TCP59295.1 amidase/aspartyl-tRNA(Asn)/glutamyl-tRNA(Gln) amidotransferase subunit A [Tumebacillus sp. BK434]